MSSFNHHRTDRREQELAVWRHRICLKPLTTMFGLAELERRLSRGLELGSQHPCQVVSGSGAFFWPHMFLLSYDTGVYTQIKRIETQFKENLWSYVILFCLFKGKFVLFREVLA